MASAEVLRDLHFNPLRVVAEGGSPPGGFDHWVLLPHYLLYVALLWALQAIFGEGWLPAAEPTDG